MWSVLAWTSVASVSRVRSLFLRVFMWICCLEHSCFILDTSCFYTTGKESSYSRDATRVCSYSPPVPVCCPVTWTGVRANDTEVSCSCKLVTRALFALHSHEPVVLVWIIQKKFVLVWISYSGEFIFSASGCLFSATQRSNEHSDPFSFRVTLTS